MIRDVTTAPTPPAYINHVDIVVGQASANQINLAIKISDSDGTVLAQWGEPGQHWGPTPLANDNVNVVAILTAIEKMVGATARLPSDVIPS